MSSETTLEMRENVRRAPAIPRQVAALHPRTQSPLQVVALVAIFLVLMANLLVYSQARQDNILTFERFSNVQAVERRAFVKHFVSNCSDAPLVSWGDNNLEQWRPNREESTRKADKVNLHPAFVFPQLYRCPVQSPPSHEEHQSQSREDIWLYEKIFLHNISLSEGTFIEIGALDGKTFSNTWYFEQKWDWRGILIEGLPSNQLSLRATKRNNVAVFTTGICHENPGTLTFTNGGGAVGGTKEFSTPQFLKSWHGSTESANVESACVPLQPILDVTGIVDVDLFSLDVEGAELVVLETIDWSVTNIHVIVVELDNLSPVKDQNVRDLLLSKGFENAMDKYGSIRDACVAGEGCTLNEVFINPRYYQQKRSRFQRYQYGTGLKCP